MQERDGHDEGEIEPVRHIDVGFLALDQRAEEQDEVGDPDDGEPEIGVPLRLGIFPAFGNAEQIAGRRHHDEDLVAPEHEPGEALRKEPRPAGPLHHVKARRHQGRAAEGEDHGRGVKRPHAPEVEEGREIEVGESQLQRDDHAHEEADAAPKHGEDRAVADRLVEIAVAVGVDERRRLLWPARHHDGCDREHRGHDAHVRPERRIDSKSGESETQERAACERDEPRHVAQRRPRSVPFVVGRSLMHRAVACLDLDQGGARVAGTMLAGHAR
jgi:hypothetical protein